MRIQLNEKYLSGSTFACDLSSDGAIRPKKRELHELPYAVIVKSGTVKTLSSDSLDEKETKSAEHYFFFRSNTYEGKILKKVIKINVFSIEEGEMLLKIS